MTKTHTLCHSGVQLAYRMKVNAPVTQPGRQGCAGIIGQRQLSLGLFRQIVHHTKAQLGFAREFIELFLVEVSGEGTLGEPERQRQCAQTRSNVLTCRFHYGTPASI